MQPWDVEARLNGSKNGAHPNMYVSICCHQCRLQAGFANAACVFCVIAAASLLQRSAQCDVVDVLGGYASSKLIVSSSALYSALLALDLEYIHTCIVAVWLCSVVL
jgi:hypothetical protein